MNFKTWRKALLLLALNLGASEAMTTDVTGQVSKSVGGAVTGARMTLFTSNLSYFLELRSDAAGSYRFTSVPNGTYRLGAAARGYEYQEVAVTVLGGNVTQAFVLSQETQTGRWTIIGDTYPELLDGTGSGTLLPNGEIFYCHDGIDPVRLNPVTMQKFYPPGSGSAQGCHVTTVLNNQALCMLGGSLGGYPYNPSAKNTKFYFVSTNSWQPKADMNKGRWYPGIVRLPDERLLIVGGHNADESARTATCEIYNPAANSWTWTGSMSAPTEMPPMTLLFTGEVFRTWRYPQIYNLASGQWRNAPDMVQHRLGQDEGQHCDHATVMLKDGRIMLVGIDTRNISNPSFSEFYDPATNSWSRGPNPQHLRQRPEVLVLPDHRVLAYGGEYSGNNPGSLVLKNCGTATSVATNVTDLYDPATNTWRALAGMTRWTHYHSVGVLVPDGRVLDTGGAGTTSIRSFAGDDDRVEAFEPPYLFRGVRPQIDSVSGTNLPVGGTFTLNVSRTSAVTEVVLLGTQAVTHWIDGGTQRYLSLNFTQSGSQVQATLPNDPVRALPGQYLLFALVDDIPSVGKIVRIVPGGTPNTPPAVSLSSPANGANFTAPANLTLAAAATDSDGSVTQVEFFNGPASLGVDTTAPYSFAWNNVPAGGYTLTARATDNSGATGNSSAVNITVGPQGQSPYLGAPVPLPGQVFAANFDLGGEGSAYRDLDSTNNGGAYRPTEGVDLFTGVAHAFTYGVGWVQAGEWLEYSVNVTAAGAYTLEAEVASNGAGGTIHVEFNGVDKTGPLTVPNTGGWNTFVIVTRTGVNLTAGLQIMRIAMDTNGATGFVGNLFSIRVVSPGGNIPPAVTIASPSNGAVFTAPAAISITAQASDSDGSVVEVDFYSGTAFLGSATESPFSFTWNNVPAGSYTLTAKAVDNNGAATTSTPVNITVKNQRKDFNADGKADVLFRHPSSGDVFLWLMK